MDTIDHQKTPAKPEAKSSQSLERVLRAKPPKGPVDHASLTREIIAGFPKILAVLVK